MLGDDDKEDGTKNEKAPSEEGKPLDLPISKEQMELQKKAKEYLAAKSNEDVNSAENDEGEAKSEQEENQGKKKGRKRKRTKEFDDESSEEESSGDEADDDLPPGMEKKVDQEKKDSDEKEGEESNENKEANELNDEENKDKEKDDLVDNNEKSKKEIEDQKENDDSNNDEKKGELQDTNNEEIDGVKPRPLHKVTSIFLRNLSPTITKQEVEAMCRRYPGFLRAAIADPSPERRWFRRGWVTFERDTKIKDICFNLNNIRLR